MGGPTRPLARELNPRLVFERLFRATHPSKASSTRDKWLLDRVLEMPNNCSNSLARLIDRELMSTRSQFDPLNSDYKVKKQGSDGSRVKS